MSTDWASCLWPVLSPPCNTHLVASCPAASSVSATHDHSTLGAPKTLQGCTNTPASLHLILHPAAAYEVLPTKDKDVLAAPQGGRHHKKNRGLKGRLRLDQGAKEGLKTWTGINAVSAVGSAIASRSDKVLLQLSAAHCLLLPAAAVMHTLTHCQKGLKTLNGINAVSTIGQTIAPRSEKLLQQRLQPITLMTYLCCCRTAWK